MIENVILITGIPRSGTTLTCHLLNKLPNTIALHEPIDIKEIVKRNRINQLKEELETFINHTRQTLLSDGTAISKHINGNVPDNPFGNYTTISKVFPVSWRGHKLYLVSLLKSVPFLRNQKNLLKKIKKITLRKKHHTVGRIKFEKNLSDDFLLCIKQNEPFTIPLASLDQQFNCFAIIRNPLAVLASWNSVNFSLQKGKSGAFIKFQHPLAESLNSISNKYDRQIRLLDFMFKQYYTILPTEKIFKYEDIIASQGKVLKAISKQANYLEEPLSSKNENKLYNPKIVQELRERLLNFDGAFWHYYTKKQIKELNY